MKRSTTAHSPNSPRALTRHVNERLGGERKPMICRVSNALGLTYVPQYVLRDEQITALVMGAAACAQARSSDTGENAE
jgi:hypothetical protein